MGRQQGPTEQLTLAIETSNPSLGQERRDAGSVAVGLVRRDEVGEILQTSVLSSQSLEPARRHDDALTPTIDAVCRSAGATAGDLHRVAVSIGPGALTGLRIAAVTAKMIAEATGAEAVATPTALIAVWPYAGMGRVAVALSCKREEAFITIFNAVSEERACPPPGMRMEVDELRSRHQADPLWALIGDGHLPDSFERWAREAGVERLPLVLTAQACFEASVRLPAMESAAKLAPMYARAPEAVRLWDQRRGAG